MATASLALIGSGSFAGIGEFYNSKKIYFKLVCLYQGDVKKTLRGGRLLVESGDQVLNYFVIALEKDMMDGRQSRGKG